MLVKGNIIKKISTPKVKSFVKGVLASLKNSTDLKLKHAYNTILPSRIQNVGDPTKLWNADCLFFLHIPKTGGSTLNTFLYDFFHPLQICPALDSLEQFTKEQLLQYKFYSPHSLYNDFLNLPHERKNIITLFRNPIERITSLYYFWRSHKLSTLDSAEHYSVIMAKENNLSDFLQLKGVFQNAYDNVYLRILTDNFIGADNRDPLLEKDCSQLIELAKQRLEQFDVVGILEEFDLTIKLIAHQFNLTLNKTIVPQNVLDISIKTTPDRFEKLKKETLDDKKTALLENCTRYDKIIYDYAKELFAKQVQEKLGNKNKDCYAKK